MIDQLPAALHVEVARLDPARFDLIEQEEDTLGLAEHRLGHLAADARRVAAPRFHQQARHFLLPMGRQRANGGQANFL